MASEPNGRGGKPAASPTVTLAQAGAQANTLRGQGIVPDGRGKVGDAGCTTGEPALLQLPFSDGLSLACCAAHGACRGWPRTALHNRRMQRQRC